MVYRLGLRFITTKHIQLFSFVFLLCITLTVNAQYKIEGGVFYKNKPLSAISVSMLGNSESHQVTQSDGLGNFFFNNLEKGIYRIQFSSINFKRKEILISLNRDTIIKTSLEELTNSLNDVQINFKKQLIGKKVDRTVFNVENSTAAIGTDALELLAKVPGVRVLNDKVSLVGKGGLNVMVNDKLIQLTGDDLSNFLKSMSSDNISKVEVITNPPAKYDAQGNNGLINIVLKKNTSEGLRGSVNSTFTQANYPTIAAGGNLSYKKDKINLFANFNIRKGSTVPLEQSNIFYQNQTWTIVNKDRNFRTVPGGQFGIDYQISKKTIVGLSYNGSLTNFHSEENIKTTILNNARLVDSILNSDANAIIKSHYNAANFYVKQALDSAGKQLTINGDWFKYNDNKSRFFNNTSYFQDGLEIPGSFAEYLSESNQIINLYTLKADVDLPYRSFNLSFGSKLSFIKNESNLAFYKKQNEFYRPDLSQTNDFNYQENTQAVYMNVSKKVKDFDFQAGLRAEYSQVNGESINQTTGNRYFQLFPTLFMTYRATESSVFSANYGRRINRPAYKKLNPFRWYSNQFTYAEGNPFLQPSFNNNIELSHTYKSIFTTTLSFNKLTNGYNDVNFIDQNSNIQIYKPVNFVTGYNYQLSNSFVFNNLKWLESINQVDVFYNLSKSNLPQTLNKVKGFGAYFSTVNQFVLNRSKTVLGDISFWYQFPTVDGLNKNKSQSNVDIGLKTLLLNKKLQLAINASDVLKSNRFRFGSVINNIRQEYNNYYDNRQLRISIRFNFGNEKIKQLVRKTGNEEERRRTN
ncbi:outer membrane beta-barrel family protein [Pedobacter sp. Leaf176]|uniref:outer membrane beta-barrel family protein n=1 Tax=Pedobacter sp. Leaf176 TaxID=1736286 RepID=UPI0009EB9E2B|nr:outer membrane beta-barrel family protein [Pedobacter sp. Leaf176]